uniref:Uncharacterized protein n=1 Tax=Marseillevirus sp. TaxID=2809551 RepID=A0AA96ENE5_9VIRU|nr:hypothetical protein MarDSR_234 [Marseillevirus sp.]
MLCGTTTTTYRRGVKHGTQTMKSPECEIVTKMYRNGEEVKETKQ